MKYRLTATTTLLAFVTALISLASFQVFARTASQHFNPDDFENNDHKGDMSSLEGSEVDDGYFLEDNEFGAEDIDKRQGPAGAGLSKAQKDKIVEVHNNYRRGEGSSNMHMLKYSEKLGRLAQEWANRCNFNHRPHGSYNPKDYGFESVGESLWMSTASYSSLQLPAEAIKNWFDEKKYYNYNRQQCSSVCGHYTQVVWHNTKEVGCGLAKCPSMQNGYFFVCNYGPAGNFQGEIPFKKGSPCSQCSSGAFYCTNNLCDDTCRTGGSGRNCECKAACVRGVVTPDCKCRCNPGYTGVDCSEICQNKDRQCGGNPGWPESWCRDKNVFGGMMYETVNTKCPLMCGKCTVRRQRSEQRSILDFLAEDEK